MSKAPQGNKATQAPQVSKLCTSSKLSTSSNQISTIQEIIGWVISNQPSWFEITSTITPKLYDTKSPWNCTQLHLSATTFVAATKTCLCERAFNIIGNRTFKAAELIWNHSSNYFLNCATLSPVTISDQFSCLSRSRYICWAQLHFYIIHFQYPYLNSN